ncbi:unnamed protein product [Linum trigynum]|uniref:Uncharacterized protein n=1 Tax=Linum trigynum TaxID=586398 RepID=A0AAV2E8Q7_9ROSI
MSTQLDHGGANPNPAQPEPTTLPVGGTEYNKCRVVPAATDITVLALLLSKPQKYQFSKIPSTSSRTPTQSSAPCSTSTLPPTPSLSSPLCRLTSRSSSSISPPLPILSPEPLQKKSRSSPSPLTCWSSNTRRTRTPSP